MKKHSVIKKINGYLAEKDYINARKLIRNDLKRYGSKDEYYMYLGLASVEPEERLKNYEKSIEANPQNLDAIINFANALDELGKFDEAIKYYNKALDIDKNCALVYNNRGYSYYQKKDYESALKDYDKALLLNPKLKIAADNREKLLLELDGNKEFTALIKSSEEKKCDYKYYFNLGMTEARLGNYNEAEEAYKKSIELNPDFAPCYMFYGILEHGRGDYSKAENLYTKAIEVDENMIDAYYNRAQLVFSKKSEDEKELKKALKDLKTAVKLDKNFIDAHYSMAVIRKNFGDYKEALKSLDTILDIAPDSVNARALKKLIIKKYLN